MINLNYQNYQTEGLTILIACKREYFEIYDAVTLTISHLKVFHGIVPQNS